MTTSARLAWFVVLDAAGDRVAESRHFPYGEVRWTWPEDEGGTFPTDYRFTGQRLDGYIKLVQMGSRWYDPALGRWTSPDSIVPGFTNPQSLNRYSFVLANPLKYRDPSGHRPAGPCEEGDTCELPPESEVPGWLQELLADPAFLQWLAEQVAPNVPIEIWIQKGGLEFEFPWGGGLGNVTVRMGAKFPYGTTNGSPARVYAGDDITVRQKFNGGFVQLSKKGEFTFAAESTPAVIFEGDSLVQSVVVQERCMVGGGLSGLPAGRTSNVSATFTTPIKVKGPGSEMDFAPYVNMTLSVDNAKIAGTGVVAAIGALGSASLPGIVMTVLQALGRLGPGSLQPSW